MNIDITGVKFELTDSLKEHVSEKMSHMTRFFDDKITQAKVVLEVDDGHHKHGKIYGSEIIIRVPGQKDVFTKAWTEDMHRSINEACEEAEIELKKIKDRGNLVDDEKIRKIKEGELEY